MRFMTLGVAAALCFAVVPACSNSGGGGSKKKGNTIQLDEAAVFLEENATDGDLGIHMFFDGEGWISMTVTGPNGVVVWEVATGGTLSTIGSTEVFTESAEPPFSQLPRNDFLALFPEGVYMLEGTTVNGDRITGTSTLSHVMPGEPVVLTPQDDDVVDPDQDYAIEWVTVPDPPGAGNEIVGYEIVVEQEEPLQIYRFDRSATDTEVTVPADLLEEGLDTKVEVIAISENGNKTAAEIEIEVEAP